MARRLIIFSLILLAILVGIGNAGQGMGPGPGLNALIFPSPTHFEGSLDGWTNNCSGATTVDYTTGHSGIALRVSITNSSSFGLYFVKTISMPKDGTMTYWLYSTASTDLVSVSVDSNNFMATGQSAGWQQFSVPITRGTHTITLGNVGGYTSPCYVAFDEITFQ